MGIDLETFNKYSLYIKTSRVIGVGDTEVVLEYRADDIVGEEIQVDVHGTNIETVTVSAVENNVLTVAPAFSYAHDSGIVVARELAPDVVSGDSIQDDAIDSEHYVDGSIDRAHLAADVIDGTKIEDDSIDSEHYVAGSIDNEHMAANSIDSDQYVDGSIDTEHLDDAQVTPAKSSFFNVFNSDSGIYAGSVASDGTANLLPSGWSSSRPSTGTFRVTHNLNDLNVIPIITPSPDDGFFGTQNNLNYFDVTFKDENYSSANRAFKFIAIRF